MAISRSKQVPQPFNKLAVPVVALVLAAATGSVCGIYRCPPPANPLPNKFLGSWSVAFTPTPNGARDYITAGAFWNAATPGNLFDTYFCFTDTSASGAIAHFTIGSAAKIVSCGLLDITDAARKQSVSVHLQFLNAQCPARPGQPGELSHNGWKQGSMVAACPSDSPTSPAALQGDGDMAAAGYEPGSFMHIDDHSWSLVNEGALVTGWCNSNVAKRPAGITEYQFCNNPAGSAFCVGGTPSSDGSEDGGAAVAAKHRRMQFGGKFGPGRGCAWARISAATPGSLEFKWGAYLANGTAVCPTDMTDSFVVPFNATA